jgi:asparagine synthetase B (glutamine-hydrolysing)
MDWDLVINLFYCGGRAKYFTSEMKVLTYDYECFEIFPPGHIFSNKLVQK